MDKFHWLQIVFLVLAWAAAISMAQMLPNSPYYLDSIDLSKWEVRHVVRFY